MQRFDAFNKKIIFFVGHLGFHAIEKKFSTLTNCHTLYVGFGLSTHQLTENNEKTLYMLKNKVV